MKQTVKSRKQWVVGCLGLLVVLGGGAGLYLYRKHVTNTSQSSASIFTTKNLVSSVSSQNKQQAINTYKAANLSGLTNTEKADHYTQLATFQMANNDCTGALSSYQQALQFNMNLPGAYIGMARCNVYLGNKTAAKNDYQKAIALYQNTQPQNESVTAMISQLKNDEAGL